MNDLERSGLDTLRAMGFKCFGDLGDVQICKVFPDASFSSNEHFEFDYFVLYKDKCIVGEMSGLSDVSQIKRKYKTFRSNINLLRSNKDNKIFRNFNIPSSEMYLFDEVRSIQGFFIAHNFERFDLDLSEVSNIGVIYRGDWITIQLYADYMGIYTRYPFLNLIKVTEPTDMEEDLRFEVDKSKLKRMPNRLIATDIDVRADIFTFETHPINLLRIAEVYRRELMPVVAFTEESHYQRRLDIKKLKSMYDLVKDIDFTFPTSILVTLKEDCVYDNNTGKLTIPKIFGSMSIIDGQHRLFSYANREILDKVREGANILVTALRFKTDDPNIVLRCSAKTFIEINKEQKRISSDHISEIAYSVLGKDYPQALAARIILLSNQRNEKALHGMFNSSQTTKGVFKAATVITYLARITDKNRIKSLLLARTGKKAKMKLGYQNLFGKDVVDLSDAETIIEQGVICFERYFGCVKQVFRQDWPDRGDLKNKKGTTLAYTKVFSAFVKLLDQFIREGLDWLQLEQELKNIRKNILLKRGLPEDYSGVVLAKDAVEIPDEQTYVNDTFEFLNKNRSTPTSISEVRKHVK